MKLCINEATTMPYTFEEDVRGAKKAGFSTIEVWWPKLDKYIKENSLKDAKKLLDKHEVVPVSLCPLRIWPFRDSEEARLEFKEAIKAAEFIGCEMVIACPDFQPTRYTKLDAMKIHAKELKEMAQLASNHQLKLAIEPIGGHTLVPGPTEALKLWVMAGAPDNVGLLMDTFHYFRSQVADDEILAIPTERLFIVHVNDSEPGAYNELTDANRLYPTLGVIDLKKVMDNLRYLNFQGFLSVEIFRPEYWERPIDSILRDSYDYLSKMLTY